MKKIGFSPSILIMLTILASLVTQASGSPEGLANTPWPMFMHDPQHTGRSPYLGSQSANLKWKFKTGSFVESSPAIGSDGTIYVGSDDNYVYAIKPNGALKWKFKTGYLVYSSPTIGSDGTIYVGSEDDYVYAIGGKAPSEITCSLSSSSIAAGGSVLISGKISPSVSASVSILYSADNVTWVTFSTLTSIDGSYSYTLDNIPAGRYYIKASWSGNEYYEGATSEVVMLTVVKVKPTLSLQAPETVQKGEAIVFFRLHESGLGLSRYNDNLRETRWK